MEDEVAQLRRQLAEEQRRLEEEQRRREEAERKLSGTTFLDYLSECHKIFTTIQVERNELRRTTGRVTSVDGKFYPRHLQPWANFAHLHDKKFADLKEEFQQQNLFPSIADLGRVTRQTTGRTMTGEDDLRYFEYHAIQDCVEDLMLPYFRRYDGGSSDQPTSAVPKKVSFYNYPLGVVANESDEVSNSDSPGYGDPDKDRKASANQQLLIRSNRPAYLGALAVAKRDMDEAEKRVRMTESEREQSGPPTKKSSPERTKLHPDQWCFRTNQNGAVIPLFTVEYKAAHKLETTLLQSILREPDSAASLFADALQDIHSMTRALKTVKEGGGPSVNGKVDTAKVLAQAFHYMVVYGLQYSYVTTGEALIFLHLDPHTPSTLYYHLSTPKTDIVDDTSMARDELKKSAVALVATLILLSLEGDYMNQEWKKQASKVLKTCQNPTRT